MTKSNEASDEEAEPVNTRPGPTDEGGHGGMATREQEARLERALRSTDDEAGPSR